MNNILKVILTILVLCFNSIYLFSAQKKVIVHDTIYIEQHMDELLNSRVSLLEKENESFHQLIDNAAASVSNSISASDRTINCWGYVIGIFSILLTILGAYLGVYVTKISDKVEGMLKDVNMKDAEIESIKQMVETSKNEVIQINEQINKDLTKLYNNLRKEETKALINRLKEEPLDISNVATLLLSRKLEDDLFKDLKQAYLKGLNDNSFEETQFSTIPYKQTYLLLFFQHFPYQAALDKDLWNKLIESFPYCCDCAFKSDILKTTAEICKALNEDQTPFNKQELLIKYLEAINISKHNKFTLLADIFNKQLKDTELLNSAIEVCKKNKVYLSIWGIEPSQDEVQEKGETGTDSNVPE